MPAWLSHTHPDLIEMKAPSAEALAQFKAMRAEEDARHTAKIASAEPVDLTEMMRPEGAPSGPLDALREAAYGEAFRVTNDAAAEWAIRKLAAARETIASVDAQRREYVAAVGRWADQASIPAQHSASYFEGLLTDYLIECNEVDPKLKSITLPSGEIASRKTGGGWAVADEDALFAWLSHTHPDLIEMRPRLLKAAANKVVTSTDAGVTDTEGEVVPGVEAIPEGRSVTIHTDIPGGTK